MAVASPAQIDLIRTLFAERDVPQAEPFLAEIERSIAAQTLTPAFASLLITSIKLRPRKAVV